MNLSEMIVDLSSDPFNPELNFNVAKEYLSLNQTASAVSFFLRCAEYGGKNNELVYSSLCAMALCFNDQRGREYSVTNCILQAIEYDDSRPEGWFLLSQFHERLGNWQECYTFARIGHNWAKPKPDALDIELGYYGSYCLEFQLGISAWWIGRKEESIQTLLTLSKQELHPTYALAVKDNLEKINVVF